MFTHAHWKAAIYVCLVAYVLFVGWSMRQIHEMVLYVHAYPEEVGREAREMVAGLQSMRDSLPAFMTTPGMTYEDMARVFQRQEAAQNASIARIEGIFRGDPRQLEAMRLAFAEGRKARARLAQRMEHNKSLEAALRGYTTEVAPHVANIIATLEAIARAADADSRAVRARMVWRLGLTTVLSLVIGAVLLAALVLADRREREKNRQISHRDGLFSLLARNVDEVFIIARGPGDIEYVSPNSGRLTGIDAEELRAHPELLRGFLPEADARRLDRLLAGVDEDADAPEISFQRDSRVFSVSVYPAEPEERHSGRRIILVGDRTRAARHARELSDALESARIASAAKSSFLSHMSHEIRTPMNAIIGMTAIAMNRRDDPARVQDCLGKISESSRHLLGIINDVLDMSKIESGKLSISHAPFNFPGVIRNMVDVIQPQATARGLNFDVILQDVTEEELLGDSLRLTQVLVNILGNSVKFTPAEGEVRVVIRQLSVLDGRVRFRFTISDTGIGMSEEFLQRIFVPFEQATDDTAARYGGTGLGMPITLSLVTLMGGDIAVASEEGRGSVFTVELPFGLGEAREDQEGQLAPLRVLVVKGDAAARGHAIFLLERLGVEAREAPDVASAVEALRHAKATGAPFDVCLLGWRLSDMEGVDAARRIRAEGDALMLVACVNDKSAIEAEAREAGVDEFLATPVFSSALRDMLAELSRRRSGVVRAPAVGKSYDFSGRRVLLVEDNDFNQEIAQEFLSMVNMETELAENGEVAVRKFQEAAPGHYDLILMDVQMPVMDGHTATRRIRACDHPDAATIPILAMTANAFSGDVTAALAAGMNGHIAKPMSAEDLYRAIDACLNNTGDVADAGRRRAPAPEGGCHACAPAGGGGPVLPGRG